MRQGISRAVAGVAAVGVAAALAASAGHTSAAERRQGTELVGESFTGATADPRFIGYGSACLTGAPRGATPGPGEHTLAGCRLDPVGPVPPGNGAPHGYLQLTDAHNDQSGAVLFDSPIPATDGLDVTFEQWQYGNTTQVAADGISFFLTDGATRLTQPGAFGGSLGYAQKLPDDDPNAEFIPGVNGGYLGIGLDVLGNYFGDWEHRGNGCAQRSPAGTGFHVPGPGANMVTVRGPGNGTEGYCWLDATTSNKTTTGPWPSTLPGTLQGNLASIPPDATPAQAEALLEPVKRTVHVVVSPAPNPVVTVDIDFQDGRGFQRVLSFAAPEPVPDTYKFGFAASTGLFTDVHLIRRVVLNSERPLGELELKKEFAGWGEPGKRWNIIRYRFIVTNRGEEPLNTITINDRLAEGLHCPPGILAPGESVTCTGSHTVTQEDRERGFVENTAIATGLREDDGSTVTSNESSLTVEVNEKPKPKHAVQPNHAAQPNHAVQPKHAAQPNHAARP
ncbi:hypothetical protein ACFOY4_11000 [Actinomadura syzygii]|uniref:DUF7507 domain-containing protein n=1 Tax=Actinomadura syzygii TaxID=1427538 RepID=A0A5D0U6E2_9ACTN|nr:hypothetical protein [Actinomadura syzygii]TYC13293.1 hypothetical protein FXF65_22640 [Actinomadura syzygii]